MIVFSLMKPESPSLRASFDSEFWTHLIFNAARALRLVSSRCPRFGPHSCVTAVPNCESLSSGRAFPSILRSPHALVIRRANLRHFCRWLSNCDCTSTAADRNDKTESSPALGPVTVARHEEGGKQGPPRRLGEEGRSSCSGDLLQSIFTWMSEPGNRAVVYINTALFLLQGSKYRAVRNTVASGRLEKTAFFADRISG